jgi:hypothetical protein
MSTWGLRMRWLIVVSDQGSAVGRPSSSKHENMIEIAILSIPHHAAQLVGANTDSPSQAVLKTSLRDVLRAILVRRGVSVVLEEWSLPEMTIARQAASENEPEVPWKNIDMDDDQRRSAGIFEEQTNRPERLVWGAGPMPESVRDSVPSYAVREQYFVDNILEFKYYDGTALVLLGEGHVIPATDKLRAMGLVVTIRAI